MTESVEKNIYQRLNAIMGDLERVEKEQKKVNGQYAFVSHDTVAAAVRPLLVKHGVLAVPTPEQMTQNGNRTEIILRLDFINIDRPDEVVTTTSLGYGVDGQDKGPGKALSYAYKYAILKMFCVSTGDDPDMHAKAVFRDSQNTTFQAHASKKEVEGLVESLKKCSDSMREEMRERVKKLGGNLEKVPYAHFLAISNMVDAHLDSKEGAPC